MNQGNFLIVEQGHKPNQLCQTMYITVFARDEFSGTIGCIFHGVVTPEVEPIYFEPDTIEKCWEWGHKITAQAIEDQIQNSQYFEGRPKNSRYNYMDEYKHLLKLRDNYLDLKKSSKDVSLTKSRKPMYRTHEPQISPAESNEDTFLTYPNNFSEAKKENPLFEPFSIIPKGLSKMSTMPAKK